MHIFANKLIYYLFSFAVIWCLHFMLHTLLYIKNGGGCSSWCAGGGGAPPGGWWGVLLLVCWWGVLLLVCWWAASYCQRIPGRRARGSRFRAAVVSRQGSGFRVFFQIRISLIINYLHSPIGLYKTKGDLI